MSIKHFPADTTMKKNGEGELMLTFLNDPKIDGELYNYLMSMSYGEDGITVVYKSNLPSQEGMAEILKVSRRTIVNHLKYLKEKGYLIDDNKNKRYILPKVENMYFQIPQETTKFLRDTVREPVIKTFIYLGQRNSYKPGQYVFTIKEICEHLGLNYQSSHGTINNYLIILAKCGLIKYSTFYINNKPQMRLLEVSVECPKINEQKNQAKK